MSAERYFEVIRRPLLTEKTTRLEAHDVYAFLVAPWADKHTIKQAVSSLFGVDVLSVNVLNRKGKTKRRQRVQGRRKDTRIAYIRLAEGQSLSLAEPQEVAS